MRFSPTIRIALCALALLITLPSHAQDGQLFGDWKIECDEEGACALAQSVLPDDSETPVLVARAIKEAEGPSLMIVSTPWGVLLQRGVAMSVDGGAITLLPYDICDPIGCHLAVELTPELLASMKAGARAQFAFTDASEQQVGPELSLRGFTAGWDALPL